MREKGPSSQDHQPFRSKKLEFSTPAAIVGALIGASVMLTALAYLRAMSDAPAGVGYWTAAYALWVLRLGCFLSVGHLEPQFIAFVAAVLQSTASLFLIYGPLHFVGRHPPVMPLSPPLLPVTPWSALTA